VIAAPSLQSSLERVARLGRPASSPANRQVAELLRRWDPRSVLGQTVRQAMPYLPHDLALELFDKISSAGILESQLRLRVYRNLGLIEKGLLDPRALKIEDHGLVSARVVTTAGVGFIVDAFQNSTEIENMKFHGIGTGTTAEAVGDTALVTELTTQYNPDNTRATGTTTEAAANIYQTVATNTLDSGTPAVTEHGVLSQAATGGGVLLDRSVFSAINLNGTNGDGLQSDYRLTLTAGG
jgi:hypothetical protein